MDTDQTTIRRQSDTVCLALVCYLVAGRLLGMGFHALIGTIDDASETFIQVLLLASYTLSIGVPLCMLAKDTRLKQFLAKPAHPLFFKSIALFFACCFVVTVLNMALSSLLELAGIAVRTSAAALPKIFSALIVYGAHYTLFPAFFEELLFRGFILSRLRVFGNRFAVIVSALLFAAVHLDITQFAGIFIMAVLFGWLTVESKSLVPAMFLHFLNNILTLIMMYLRTTVPAHIYNSVLNGAFLMCGTAALVVFVISILHRRSVLLGAQPNPFRFFKGFPAMILIAMFIVLFLERIEVMK